MSIPLTAKGAERLRELVSRLKSVDRPQVIAAIAEARAHGDLSENAEYHAAREQQSFIEGRISQLEFVLAEAQVIDVSLIESDNDHETSTGDTRIPVILVRINALSSTQST